MTKTVFKGHGVLLSGRCPVCPEKVSVFMKNGESYKNSRCTYCGSEVHGDKISDVIRQGHCKIGPVKKAETPLSDPVRSSPRKIPEQCPGIKEYIEHEKGMDAGLKFRIRKFLLS